MAAVYFINRKPVNRGYLQRNFGFPANMLRDLFKRNLARFRGHTFRKRADDAPAVFGVDREEGDDRIRHQAEIQGVVREIPREIDIGDSEAVVETLDDN